MIGGGPAGLAAAIAARQRGLAVTVADCATAPIDKACGEGIMPDGIAAARALGISLEHTGAQPFRGIRFVEKSLSVEADFPQGHGLGMRRTVLHDLMVERARAAGAELIWDSHVSGISADAVMLNGREIRARWIVGADGGNSPTRRWAGLDAFERNSRRFAFRRHYAVDWAGEFMEIHWTGGFQIYITPVAPHEVCVVLISRDPHLRLDDALAAFPEVRRRLHAGETRERGAVSVSRRLRSVARGRVALIGDASGSVDAITGEGIRLLFRQSILLADALEADDLEIYRAGHRKLGRRPELMADLMLLLDRHDGLRRRVLRAMASQPRLFASMLATHIGDLSLFDSAANGLALGWQLLHV